MNGTVASAYSNIVPNVADPGVPAVPVAPTGLTVAIAAGVATLNWSHPGGASLIDFTIQRATNATFTLGVSSLTAAAGATTAQDTVPGAGPYYYRIRANGSAGSSAWTNASPFPVGGALTIISLTANQTSPFRPAAPRRSPGRRRQLAGEQFSSGSGSSSAQARLRPSAGVTGARRAPAYGRRRPAWWVRGPSSSRHATARRAGRRRRNRWRTP